MGGVTEGSFSTHSTFAKGTRSSVRAHTHTDERPGWMQKPSDERGGSSGKC